MKLDKYKQAISDAYMNSNSNIFVNASAGTGKTSLLLHLLEVTPSYKDCLFLAFNKSIVEELESRCMGRAEVKTIHSKAFSTLLSNKRCRFKLSKWRDYAICKEYLVPSWKMMEDKKINGRIMNISRLYQFARMNLVDVNNREQLEEICDRWGVDFDTSYWEDLKKFVGAIDEKTNGLRVNQLDIDFTDQLYLTYKYIRPELYPKYDVIFCDEAQDLNSLQRELILRMLKENGRLITVGDEMQCQPAGTKVLTCEGVYKNIEDLSEGERIVSYEYRHDNCFIGDYSRIMKSKPVLFKKYVNESKSFIKRIASRDYDGDLFRVKIGDLESLYTPNHICYVRWRPGIKNKYVLYLMRKGDWFRIGVTPYSVRRTGYGSFCSRFYTEDADAAWLLNLYDNKKDARFDEMYLSYKYGIPQTIFNCRQKTDTIIGQEGINRFYDKFEGILYERALRLLNDYGREIDCPFITKIKGDSRWKAGSVYMFNTYACNVFPDMMQMIVYDKWNYRKTSGFIARTKPTYRDIDGWNRVPYKGKVYSLDVNYNQNYVADGILTHNCIYSFQGSSFDSFHLFKNRPNTISLPLSLTYRCAKNIVEEARKYSSDIEALPDAPDGEVRFGTLDEVKNGDYVICRNNLPLVETFIKLLKAGKKSVIPGKDYGEGLQSILSNINSLVDLKKMLEEKRKELEDKGVKNFKANEGYIALEEKVQIILILVQSFGSVESVKNQVSEIFGDKSDDKIILSTIHKSKGLEAERVFILGFHELIPSKYANTELALYGEKCLQFVAVTRAKRSLIFIPYKENKHEETEVVC